MVEKRESNDSIVLRVMRENEGKSRAEVVAILVQLLPEPPRVREGKVTKEKWVSSYYNWGLGKGAPGEKAEKAARAPKAAKTPKATKPKLIKVPKPKVQGDKPKITDKTVEEIADIRAKNLARLKAVGRKYAKGQYAEGRSGRDHTDEEARAEVANLEHELDSFRAPKFLNLSDVKALV